MVDFEGMKADIQLAPDESIVVLQLCAHNPTGADPSRDQWYELAHLLREKRDYILFDNAYQGYATGNLDADAWPARMFEDAGLEFATAQSYSKNFGLYAERIGCLSFVTNSPEAAIAISSQLKAIIRPMYSNPPVHGARIVMKILTNPEFLTEWTEQMGHMAQRILEMRTLLHNELVARKVPPPGKCADWSHIVRQIGMFSYLGLSAAQCDLIVSKFHIYLTREGRISVAGLTKRTVPKLAAAIQIACSPAAPERPSRRLSSRGSAASAEEDNQ